MTSHLNLLDLPESLLSRVEDAGINASAPPQQRWLDGWLLRFSPGQARRARCIQAVSDGCLPLDERLALCAQLFGAANLPMVLRLTPFSRPPGLDAMLASRGWQRVDDTRVMVLPEMPHVADPVPQGLCLERLDAADFAEAVGALRGSAAGQRAAHGQRLALSPVPYQGWVLRRSADAAILVCGQTATEADLVGLYDVFTHPESRGQGLARWLCTTLLVQARAAGARTAYLQVDPDNAAARTIYHHLGFADAYAYHYRTQDTEPH